MGFGISGAELQYQSSAVHIQALVSAECVTNGKNKSSFQCCLRDEGRLLIYALREEYINHFMVL